MRKIKIIRSNKRSSIDGSLAKKITTKEDSRDPNLPARWPKAEALSYFQKLKKRIDKISNRFEEQWDNRLKGLIRQHEGYDRDNRLSELDSNIIYIDRKINSDDPNVYATPDELEQYDKAIKKKAKEILFDSIEEQLEKMLDQLRNKSVREFSETQVRQIAKGFVQQTKDFSIRQVDEQIEAVAGVNPVRSTTVKRAFNEAVEENVRLIKTIPNKYHNEVERVVHSGIIKGKSLGEMEKGIYKASRKTTNNARLIARDQSGSIMSAVTKQRHKDVGLKKFRWETVGDDRVRDEHEDRGGEVYTWKDGASGEYPGGPIQCRCVATVVEEEVLNNFGEGETLAPVKPERFNPVNEGWEKDWDTRNSKYMKMGADYHNMDVDEYKKAINNKLDDMLNDAEVRVRVPKNKLDDILKDGKFKTQFETGKSGGLLDNGKRATFEKKIFGIGDDVIENRPIYGYMNNANNYYDNDMLDGYGKVIVKLDDSVKNRTTFTIGDSLDTNQLGNTVNSVPTPVKNPNYRSGTYGGYMNLEYSTGDPLIKKGINDYGLGYTEAQIHNGVSIKDIDEIIFKNKPSSTLINKLKDNNVNWRVIK